MSLAKNLIVFFIIQSSVYSYSKTIDTPDLNALKMLFGMSADKELKIYDKSARPGRINSYSIGKYDTSDAKKQYPSGFTVGNDTYFSICPAYLDLIKQAVVDEKSMEITFDNSLEDHKLVQQFFHNAFTTVIYGGRDSDQRKFVDQKIVAQKTTRIDLVSLKKGGLSAHLSVFRNCKDLRPTYWPPSQDKIYSDSLNETEEKLKKMISDSGAAGAGRGVVNPSNSVK